MKKILLIACTLLAALLIYSGDIYARGGGGGHGGGRGGMPRGGEFGGSSALRSRQPSGERPADINRSGLGPSSAGRQINGIFETRSVDRPGSYVYRPGNRDVRSFLNMPAGGGYPITGGRVEPGRVDRAYVNRQFANRYADFHHRPFGPGWYGPHVPPRWNYWHYDRYRPGYWWGWATAGMISGWIAYDWAAPVYYVYGPGGNVYYEGSEVYVNGEPAYSSTEYYNQAAAIAESAPSLDEEKAKTIEWMPLGVFSVVQDAAKEGNLALQLAVSKEGIISGTVFNETNKSTHALEGSVDKKTQRAAWSFIEGEGPKVIMETGIFNLSKDETNVLVHLGPKDTKIWTLVRLDKPAQNTSTEAASGPDNSTGVEIVDPN